MAQKPKVDPHVGRLGYLQALVTEFQETQSQDAKEQVLANLANFAYDPANYQYLRQLQVLDLFLDSLSEENETLVEFAIGAVGSPWRLSGWNLYKLPFSGTQTDPASGSFPVSQLFTSDGRSIGASASTSVLPMNTQD
ncbi:armadillo repeat-containing protein 7 isoform X3 [Odocoileus virginianus]|uniref:Armadillo repeat-containing protein 7 isoform X3 n=1 Tax=Odocoileus virginianus TaxID=9874 RepID=A0A6J0WXR6_ODOVR